MARITKKDVYAKHDILYKDEKILSPIGWIPELLKVGNSKTGKNVWTWSILPTNREFTVTVNGKSYTLRGSCPCSCVGCYATTGFYKQQNVIVSMATNQILVENHIDFVRPVLRDAGMLEEAPARDDRHEYTAEVIDDAVADEITHCMTAACFNAHGAGKYATVEEAAHLVYQFEVSAKYREKTADVISAIRVALALKVADAITANVAGQFMKA